MPKAGDFAGRRHLHPKNRISARQSTETELRDFHSNIIALDFEWWICLDREIENRIRSEFDHVDSHYFGNERKRSCCSYITFYDLYLVVLGDELDVERSSNVERIGDFLGRKLDSANCFGGHI